MKNNYLRLKQKVGGLVTILLPSLVWAGSGETPVSGAFGYIIDAMNGATGRSIAVIAIIVVGVMKVCNRIQSWVTVLVVVAGIAVIFGAPGIVDAIRSHVQSSGF